MDLFNFVPRDGMAMFSTYIGIGLIVAIVVAVFSDDYENPDWHWQFIILDIVFWPFVVYHWVFPRHEQ